MNAKGPLTNRLALHDANSGTNGVSDQKSHAAHHYDWHDLRNVMVPMMIPLVSCDTDVNTSGITWPKKSCYTSVSQQIVLT